MRLRNFTEKCEQCASAEIKMQYVERDNLPQLDCICSRCSFSWEMETAAARDMRVCNLLESAWERRNGAT